MLRITDAVQITDTGRQREANEDALFARAPVFAVADGMGGAQAGEVASQMAVEAFEGLADPDDAAPEQLLRDTVEHANQRIFELAQGDASRSGMGTTLTAAIVHGDEISFGHVGDSRAYVYRDGELKQITNDHSLVEELRRQGRLTRDQAAEHPQRSVITRALGPEPQGRGGHDDPARAARRRLPALLGRADDDALRRRPEGRPRPRGRPSAHRALARQGGQRPRRPRQHHRRPVPPRGRRRGCRARYRGGDPDRRGGRGGGLHRRRGPGRARRAAALPPTPARRRLRAVAAGPAGWRRASRRCS